MLTVPVRFCEGSSERPHQLYDGESMNTRSDVRVHSLVNRAADVIRRHSLIQPHDRVLVAVSGGPDSVCLLTVLAELREAGRIPGLQLHIAHINYGLRGSESEGDEAFVRELAARFRIPVTCEHAAPGLHSGGSFQQQARDIRYAFFERVRREEGLTSVATGHTADDQAETVLMWLLRGSGTGGLAGIPVMRVGAGGARVPVAPSNAAGDGPSPALEGGVIRPLLDVCRHDVLEYLGSRDMTYRVDASNASAVYRRNRIRHELLPLLRSFNPRIVEGLARSADILAAEGAILDKLEEAEWQATLIAMSPHRVVLDCPSLMGQPLGLGRRLVRRALAMVRETSTGLTFLHVRQVLDCVLRGRNGSGLDLPGGLHVRRVDDHLVVERGSSDRSVPSLLEGAEEVPLSIPGEVRFAEGRRRLVAVPNPPDGGLREADRWRVVVDSDRLGGPLTVRSWKPGDWLCPRGMNGHRKKLQDMFVDEKIPRVLRNRVPVVVSPAGIVWVAGYQCDERFAVRAETVRPVMLRVTEEA